MCGFISQTESTVRYPADPLSSAWAVTNRKKAVGTQGTRGNKNTRVYKGVNKTLKAVDAVTVLGLGIPPQQNAMLSGLTGLGTAQPNSLDSLFGSTGTNPWARITGLNTGLQSANGANDLFQLAALLGGQHQSVTFQPAQPLQVRQAVTHLHSNKLRWSRRSKWKYRNALRPMPRNERRNL